MLVGRWSLVGAWRDLVQGGQKIAGEQPLPEPFAQKPRGYLPGDRDPARLRHGRDLGNEGPDAAADVGLSRALEFAVGLLHRVWIDLQLPGELTNCRQRRVWRENAGRDTPVDFIDDLPKDRSRIPGIQVN